MYMATLMLALSQLPLLRLMVSNLHGVAGRPSDVVSKRLSS